MQTIKPYILMLGMLCTTAIYAGDGGLRFQEKLQTKLQDKPKVPQLNSVQEQPQQSVEQSKMDKKPKQHTAAAQLQVTEVKKAN